MEVNNERVLKNDNTITNYNMEQDPILNAHNKQEYPPMHTEETDTSLKECQSCKPQNQYE